MTPFTYSRGDGFLHRMNPAVKFLCLILLSSALMSASAPLAAGLGIACVLLAASLRVGARELLAKGRFLIWMAAFVFILKCVDFSQPPFFSAKELLPASLYVADLAILFLLAEIFFRTTRIRQLGAAVSAFFRALLRRGDVDPGLYLGLAVEFIPRVFTVFRECEEAAMARGYGRRRSRRSAYVSLVIAYLRLSIKKALWTADALEARCYRPDRSLEKQGLGVNDLIALVASLGYLAACLVRWPPIKAFSLITAALLPDI
jgi:energy-coupling factor transporter transmembrane protein EcfT